MKQSPSPGSAESPIRINSRRNTSGHILIKLTKIKFKEKILKGIDQTIEKGEKVVVIGQIGRAHV